MPEPLSFEDIKKEFDESLGYIRQDINWLCEHDCSLNYTVALLIGCACEALSDGGVGASKHTVLAELLPEGEWRLIAKPLFDALRNGLAHSFDTKHLMVGDEPIQIYMQWRMRDVIAALPADGKIGIFLGIKSLAKALIAKIDAFEAKLKSDDAACRRFRAAMESGTDCSLDTWNQILVAAGYPSVPNLKSGTPDVRAGGVSFFAPFLAPDPHQHHQIMQPMSAPATQPTHTPVIKQGSQLHRRAKPQEFRFHPHVIFPGRFSQPWKAPSSPFASASTSVAAGAADPPTAYGSRSVGFQPGR